MMLDLAMLTRWPPSEVGDLTLSEVEYVVDRLNGEVT